MFFFNILFWRFRPDASPLISADSTLVVISRHQLGITVKPIKPAASQTPVCDPTDATGPAVEHQRGGASTGSTGRTGSTGTSHGHQVG